MISVQSVNGMPMTDAAARISVGVAGWSYPDWEGYVYPGKVEDKLRYVAGYVDMIEINSTFYRPPDPRAVASWVARTGDLPDFFFTAKLHQDVTHRGVIEPKMASDFHRGLQPMADAGKLRHLLAQFRYDFAATPETRQHLEKISKTFGDIAHVTFELRHNSWQAPQELEALGALGVTVANLDYPTARNSFNMRECLVGEHAYLRLHGRNASAWFSKNAGRDETYNYRYSKPELEGIKSRAVNLANKSKSLTAVANNHYQGKEVANALQLKAMIANRKVPVPPPLVEKYPDLNDIAEKTT